MRPSVLSRTALVLLLVGRVVAGAQTAAAPAAQAPAGQGGQKEAESPEATANRLLAKAVEALGAGRLAEAQGALDAAKAANSSARGLWATYGDVAVRQGHPELAAEDFRKELALHPELYEAYGSLASAELLAGHRDAAVAALRSWNKAQPANPQPVAMLVSVLLDGGEPAEAVKAGDEAGAHLADDARAAPLLQFAMAAAEVKIGQRDRAAAGLKSVLGSTGDPSLRNSAAYLLADAGLELPLAEGTERALLEQLSLESEAWTLGENPGLLRARTALMVATWDTLGWVLFREGKLPEAEALVRASWRNSLHPLVGEHLGEIEAARGHHAAAMADLQAALGVTEAAAAAHGAGKPPSAEVTELQQRIAAEAKHGVAGDTTPEQRAGAVARLRTFRLGTAGGHTGSAAYRLLLAHGKAVHAAPLTAANKGAPGMAELIGRVDFAPFFPNPAAYLQLVQIGTVSCKAGGCELTLEP